MNEPDSTELTEEDVDLIAENLYRPTIPGLKEKIDAAIRQREAERAAVREKPPGREDPDKEPDREVDK